ncbi:hypothetical protein GCM10009809_25680 [Isoptericola hypogeus]|uniref:Uncharacterized protein n=1 Tax=Isoptericola hypogeus TaxID=300179 RepID=A0ABN2JJ19_9MICO
MRVPDGLRVPAGAGTWTLSTTVVGQTYRTTVPAGPHTAAECYDPRWDVSASAETVNADGVLQVRTTVTNDTDEPMQVGMAAAGAAADAVRLGAGETTTLAATTGDRRIDAGEAELKMTRWVADADGDLPPNNGVTPATPRRVSYTGAVLDPTAGGTAVLGDACTFDAATQTSSRTVSVPVDNTASTLAVRFAVQSGGATATAQVDGGTTGALEVAVPWGTTSLAVTADGRAAGTVEVPSFGSCATVSWPAENVAVDVATQCVDDRAQVVVTAHNRGGAAWSADLVHDGADAAELAAGGSVELRRNLGGLTAPEGSATLQLARTVEGERHVVEQTFSHDAVSCVVVAPRASLELGEIRVDEDWWRATSTRSVTVVLDNGGSNVPVDFRVVGPGGVDRQATVDGRSSSRVEMPAVLGPEGGSYTVSAGDWSTTLQVEPFTGTSGWCAAPGQWGQEYAVGDVASHRGTNYQYVGWGERDDEARNEAHDDRAGSDQATRGRRGPWAEIGRCEYR